MPELGRLQRLGREAGRLLQRERAHLGGGARLAAAEQREHGALAEPVGERPGGTLGIVQQPLAATAAASASARGRLAPASDRVSAAIITRVAAKVIVEGPCSSPPRVSRLRSARRASELPVPFVTVAMKGRSPRSRSSRTTRTVSALSPDWLTHTSSVSGPSASRRKCRSSAASTIVASTPARGERVAGG